MKHLGESRSSLWQDQTNNPKFELIGTVLQVWMHKMGFDFSEMIEMIYERTSSGCLGWICSPAPRCQGMEFPSHMLAPSFHFLKPVSFTILLVGWDDKYIEMATCKLDVIFWSLFLDLIIHFNPTIVKQSEQSGEQTSPGLKQDDDAPATWWPARSPREIFPLARPAAASKAPPPRSPRSPRRLWTCSRSFPETHNTVKHLGACTFHILKDDQNVLAKHGFSQHSF